MEERTIYEQIAKRTDGSVYIGVVGPVRSGKSTFIKRFMEQLVLPNIENVYRRERAKDELPQSGSGRTIMTAEPKFVPEEAVEISPDGKSRLSVRMIDTVGYMVRGAIGADEDGAVRMVTTPWFEEEIPMTEAAEMGTKKVMDDHSSIGIVMTTDGSITDIAREDYLEAEERAIRDMKATGKPFLVLVNSEQPEAEPAQTLCAELREKYGVGVHALSCLQMDAQEALEVLRALLYEFPVSELRFFLPGWVTALPVTHPVKATLFEALRATATTELRRLSETERVLEALRTLDEVRQTEIRDMDPGTGIVNCELRFPEKLFYEILSEKSGFPVENDAQLMALLGELSETKREYDKVASALEQVRATGYGIVMPTAEEMRLEVPQIIRKNGNFAVQLKASAPSIHMMRADIRTEISPIVGDERQSEELIQYLLGEYEGNTEKLWQSNLFGKSLFELVSDGLGAKLKRMPEEARLKLKDTLTRILNESTGGLICIIL